MLAVYLRWSPTSSGSTASSSRARIVVDIVNPVDFDTMDGVVTPPDNSSAEETAKLVPDGHTGGEGVQHHLREHTGVRRGGGPATRRADRR